MANADKGHIEVINGSIGDLIFRIETLTSDRDTIKVCVRAANELSAMTKHIATLEELYNQAIEIIKEKNTAILDLKNNKGIPEMQDEIARLTADAKLNDMAWNDNQAALNKQAEEILAIKTAIEDIKIYCNNPSAWEHYDDGVSEKIRAILKAAGMA